MNFINETVAETKSCQKCQVSFDVTDKDLEFYDKVSPIFDGKKYPIPTPKLCPECRARQRLVGMNQHSLYRSSCYKCKKNVVSRFHSESDITHYCNACWAGDDWDRLEHGMEVDFTRPIFEQIGELVRKTPFQSLIGSLSNLANNAGYTNHTSDIYNSYLVYEANNIRDTCHSEYMKSTHDAIDNSFVGDSEYVYECVDCYNMYDTYFCRQSTNCRHSYFLHNCTNCDYCIGCSNLNAQSYHIFNKPVSKQQYKKILKTLENITQREDFRKQYDEFLTKQICKQNNIVNSEYCSGDNIINSSNCRESFDILDCQDCKYCSSVNSSADLYDISSYGEKASLMYNSISVGRYSNNILFSTSVGRGEHFLYCIDVKKSKHCFGCVNLKGAEYCILNKQYTQAEYEVLVPKIIEYMKTVGEWGEFFPESISPFGYNESVAAGYFPLTKAQALERGCNWSDHERTLPDVTKTITADKLPECVDDIPDDILNWAIVCEVTGRPFKIISQELEFYRKHKLPIPRRHPDQRRKDRMSLRNPRKLFERDCDKCGIEMNTTYSLDRPEKIYCENCYNKEVY